MAGLEKIIFLADFIEPNRTFDTGKLRLLAYSDLDGAMRLGLSMSITEVAMKCSPLHPDTVEAYNFLLLEDRQ